MPTVPLVHKLRVYGIITDDQYLNGLHPVSKFQLMASQVDLLSYFMSPPRFSIWILMVHQ